MDDRSPPEPDDLPDELIHLVKPELRPGERLIWAARAQLPPAPLGLTAIQKLALWAAGITGLGAVGCAAWVPVDPSLRTNFHVVVGVLSFLALFIGILLGLITLIAAAVEASQGRFRARVFYALTDRRAILWVPHSGIEAFTIQTIPAGTIRPESVRRVQYPDGSGDVSFPEPIPPGLARPTGFIGVAEARRVEDLVRRYLVGPAPESTA